MRTWDNLGRVEDVATVALPAPLRPISWLVVSPNTERPIDLAQGRFAGRPSRITVTPNKEGNLLVSGEVWPVSHGYAGPGCASNGRTA